MNVHTTVIDVNAPTVFVNARTILVYNAHKLAVL